ncbi:MAG: LysM peptidoglycan-binding domain-containing protein [Coriobacteriia bacterium]|nr:LysM peptidoglycan-binding domain-containing protein [Coriobacteriia bacterium]
MSSTVAARSTRFNTDTRAARHAGRKHARAVAWAEIVALVLIAVALIMATVLTARHSSRAVASERMRVESGQTLWALAAQHPVAGLTTEQTAGLIASLNHISDGRVASGTTIYVPAQHTANLAVACR